MFHVSFSAEVTSRSDVGRRRTLHRGHDQVIAGVCSGIAEYQDADTVLVRVTAIVLMVCTLGLVAVAYLALAITLPPCSDDDLVEVDPLVVRSDRYREVVQAHRRSEVAHHAARADAGHRPPRPPAAAPHPVGSLPFVPALPKQPEMPSSTSRVLLVVVLSLGIVLVFALALSFSVPVLPRRTPWFYWPLLLVVAGTALLAAFPDKLSLASRLALLLLCIELCLTLLCFTLGLCSPSSLNRLQGGTVAVWFFAAVSLMGGVMFRRSDLMVLAVSLVAVAMIFTFIDVGVAERYLAMSSYSRHNQTVFSLVR